MAKGIPTEFVPLSVHYRRDRAIRAAGPMGELLFLRSLAFSRAHRTEGRIEDFDLDELACGIDDPRAVGATLVACNLWVEDVSGWRIRSWEKWNPSSTTDSEAGIQGNHERWHVRRGIVEPTCPLCPKESPDDPPDDGTESGAISGANRPDIRPIIGGIAEIEGEEREKRENTPSSTRVDDDEFETWWQAYPRKVDKGHARKAYKTARTKTDAATLLDAVESFAETCRRSGTDPKFIAHASTWLNGERWTDTESPRPRGNLTEWEAGYSTPSNDTGWEES